ncbi:MAG TPA: histidine phosphatase family protein [Amaricoccus sp.]|nr:histidine phosphatase family protein [Amaricoccus sp.]
MLVRHTRPCGGAGICYGTTDLAAAPGFEPEALHIAGRIALRIGPADRIVSSPLRRCTALAEALAEHLAAPLTLDPRWAEMDFGAWEGRPWDEIPRAELDTWAADLLHARPHGGESVAMLAARVAEAIAACPASERTVVVTHAGPIRAALASWDRPVGYGEAIAP